jgi:hypothetical protein
LVNGHAAALRAQISSSWWQWNWVLNISQAPSKQKSAAAKCIVLPTQMQVHARCTQLAHVVQHHLTLAAWFDICVAQVDNVIRQYASPALDPADTCDLITDLQKEEGAFVRFTLDSQGCLRSLFWATAEQV